MDPADWSVEYANQRFDEWFPAPQDGAALGDRIAGLNLERAAKRLQKGRTYAVESEARTGARTKVLRTTLSAVDIGERPLVLAEAMDTTKQKEQEHMLDSFAKLADRHKLELERTNAALSRKTEELEKAFGLIKSQKNRMQRELEVARQVQMNMLPSDFSPNHKECTVAGTLKPALEVGGDFFDFFYVDTDRLCFLVGDVSDKGAASGLFMAASKTLIKAHAMRAESTAGVVARVNRELSTNNDSCMFVTLFLAILDLKTGRAILTNAGHNPPYRVRSGQSLEVLEDRNGPALGIVPEAEYSETVINLEPEDLVVVYSDGVTEAMSRDNEMFGEQRLKDLLDPAKDVTAARAVRSIAEAGSVFEDGTQQTDDVTVIAVRFHGS